MGKYLKNYIYNLQIWRRVALLKRVSLTIILVLLLSSCSVSDNSSANTDNKNIIKDKENITKELESEELEESLTLGEENNEEIEIIENSTKEITQEDAEKIFYNRYEGFNIDVLKRQGQVYYIQGKNIDGNKIQKVKINIKNGDIIFEKLINKSGY